MMMMMIIIKDSNRDNVMSVTSMHSATFVAKHLTKLGTVFSGVPFLWLL